MGYTKPKSTILASAMEKPKMQATNLLLTIPEACEHLRISKWSLYRLLNENKLKSVRILGRRLIPRTEVDNFIAAQLAEGAA